MSTASPLLFLACGIILLPIFHHRISRAPFACRLQLPQIVASSCQNVEYPAAWLPEPKEDKGHLPGWAIFLIVMGALLPLLGCLYCLWRRYRVSSLIGSTAEECAHACPMYTVCVCVYTCVFLCVCVCACMCLCVYARTYLRRG